MTQSQSPSFDVWLPLARAQKSVLTQVEAVLKKAGLPGLDWYDLMWELEQAGPAGLRPYEVQNRLLLPQYGVSRLVERLAKAGYLRRQAYDGDGRGQLLVLTPEGAEIRRRMWAVYAPAIEQAVGARLSPEEAQTLATLLAKLTNKGDAPAPR